RRLWRERSIGDHLQGAAMAGFISERSLALDGLENQSHSLDRGVAAGEYGSVCRIIAWRSASPPRAASVGARALRFRWLNRRSIRLAAASPIMAVSLAA